MDPFSRIELTDKEYGLAGDLKKTQYRLLLLGFPGDADTSKCLITAAEQGMELEAGIVDIPQGEHQEQDYLAVSPFGKVPALKEADYIISGVTAVMPYIDSRGLGKYLTPRNARLAAQQDYWIDVACNDVGPHVNTLMQEAIFGPMTDSAYKPNDEAIAKAKDALSAPLDALNGQLADNDFIIGNFSFADIHWTPYIHNCYLAEHGDLIDRQPNIKSWFERIKTHKSNCGQDIVAYKLLPTLKEVKEKQIKSVVITDF